MALTCFPPISSFAGVVRQNENSAPGPRYSRRRRRRRQCAKHVGDPGLRPSSLLAFDANRLHTAAYRYVIFFFRSSVVTVLCPDTTFPVFSYSVATFPFDTTGCGTTTSFTGCQYPSAASSIVSTPTSRIASPTTSHIAAPTTGADAHSRTASARRRIAPTGHCRAPAFHHAGVTTALRSPTTAVPRKAAFFKPVFSATRSAANPISRGRHAAACSSLPRGLRPSSAGADELNPRQALAYGS